MTSTIFEESRKIGFNSEVHVGEERYHVQTEVYGRDALTIRTTALKRGVVQDADTQKGVDTSRGVEGVREVAKAQHDGMVERLRTQATASAG